MKGIRKVVMYGLLLESLLGCAASYRPSVGTAVGIISSADGIQVSRKDIATIGEGDDMSYTHVLYLPAIGKLLKMLEGSHRVYVSDKGGLLKKIDEINCTGSDCKRNFVLTMQEIEKTWFEETGEVYKK